MPDNPYSVKLSPYTMFNYYLKRAIRGLRKQPVISAINILGLSLGLACFTLFLLNVVDEFSFDRFHKNADRLFRVYTHTAAGVRDEAEHKDPYLPMPLGPVLQRDMPEVQAFTRLRRWGGFVQAPKGLFDEPMCFADPALLSMFSFPLVFGDPEQALREPFQVVLTEKMALKLFGERNPVGRTLDMKVLDQFEPYTVSGVAADVPGNSSIEFGILLPMARYAAMPRGKEDVDRWTRRSMETFVELKPGADPNAETQQLQQLYIRYHPSEESETRQKGLWSKSESPFTYVLQPIRTMRSDISVEGPAVNPAYSWILLGIGGLILLIACINFTTLAIGRSVGRAREIGVSKVMGAGRAQLARQYLGESLLLSVLSMGLGLVPAYAALPLFNQLTNKKLVFSFAQFPELYWLLPGLTVLTAFLAGMYPALVLSGLRPIETLRSKLRIGGENWFTRSLLTGQFVLSTGLLICTIIMLRQLHYLQTQNPGFNKENVVVVKAAGIDDPARTLRRFKQSLAGNPNILHISSVEIPLGGEAGWSVSGFEFNGKPIQIYEYTVDPQYVPTLGLQLLAGRNFDEHIVADTVQSAIINEAAMRLMGYSPENVLGAQLTGYNQDDPTRDPVVVGVVKDYNFGSLRDAIEPMMLQMFAPYPRENFFVRLKPGYPAQSLAQLQQAWTAIEPRIPFRYTFLDEDLNTFYKAEQRWSTVVSWAGGLCLFLACLGLFGLAALVTANRTKEIGIRKVLGATVAGITNLMARDFLKPVLIAIAIAIPLGWFLMQKWLSGFAYRIELEWWMFAAAGITAVAVAWATVSVQSIKAALANPVRSLRND